MKSNYCFIRLIALFTCAVILLCSFSSCADLEGIGSDSSEIDAGNSPDIPGSDTDLVESEAEETEPPHSDHVYEDGSCTECGASDGIAYTVDRKTNTAEVTNAGGCKQEIIVIAEYYKGCPVTHIASRAFVKAEKAKEIFLPDTVKTLAEEAFAFTTAEIITLSNSITDIPANAFKQSPNLKRVAVGKALKTVGSMAFYDCELLEAINLPDTVTEIGGRAFGDCKSLTEFRIPKGVTSLENDTFSYCSSLVEVIFHEDVKNIAHTCFLYCDKLTKLTSFPSEPDYVSNTAFNASGVPRTEYRNCLYIGNEANPYIILESCIDKSAENIEIHPNTRIITDMAFHSSSLTEVTIPDKVATVGHNAFAYSRRLKKVSMSDSVTFLGGNAFHQCISLTDIRLSDSITELQTHTFYGCKALEEIKLPESVLTVGEQIFDDCESLKTIHIPKGVKELKFHIYNAPIFEIRFGGTKDEWMKIQYLLEQYSGFTVYCSDASIKY